MRIISSQSFFLYAARPTVISTVDSGAEKSPVSMAPVPPPPTVISTETEQNGVEWRNLRPQWYQCLPLPLSFRPERSKAEWSGEISDPMAPVPPLPLSFRPKRSKAEWSGEISDPNGTSPSPPTVISTETEQSGVEWRNLRPQRHRPHCVGRSLGSEPQWSSNTLTFLPIRSPARDDRAASHRFGNFKA